MEFKCTNNNIYFLYKDVISLSAARYTKNWASCILIGGIKNWIIHRLTGPSFYDDYVTNYTVGGELHNENGPAIIFKDGRKEYYLNGKKVEKF